MAVAVQTGLGYSDLDDGISCVLVVGSLRPRTSRHQGCIRTTGNVDVGVVSYVSLHGLMQMAKQFSSLLAGAPTLPKHSRKSGSLLKQ